jgi:transposase
VIGAVCPQSGQSVGLLAPTVNTDILNAFFEPFAAEVDPKVHVVGVWDQAGFHTAGKLKVPENVTLVSLPPYSPELNPVENLWHYFRSHYGSNRAYGDYDDLRQAALRPGERRPSIHRPSGPYAECRMPYAERIN